jgi:hypothetical protein
MAQDKPAAPTPAAETEATALIRALVEGLQSRNPAPLDLLGLDPERQAALTTRQAGLDTRDVPVVGVDGLTSAIAVVARVPGMPNGKIVEFREYKYPVKLFTSEKNGGVLPDGMPVMGDGSPTSANLQMLHEQDQLQVEQRQLHRTFVLWRNETFYYRDHKAWVGQELRAHMCDPAGEGLKTPWRSAVKVAA